MTMAVSFILIAVIFPIALGLLSNADQTIITFADGTNGTLASVADPTVITLLTILLPIVGVIGLVMGFLDYVR